MSVWPTLLSLLAVMMAAYAVHMGFVARTRAEDAERHASEAADLADVALRTHGISRGAQRLRRVASGDTDAPSPWTPPNG